MTRKLRKIENQHSKGERVERLVDFGLQQMNSLGSESQKVGLGMH